MSAHDRWDGCFIRLLDGMLQAGALIATATSDFELRIPTKIRHLAIKVPGPELPIGSEGAQPAGITWTARLSLLSLWCFDSLALQCSCCLSAALM